MWIRTKGLNGFCDFILSVSQEQLILTSPVITVVEAKKVIEILPIWGCHHWNRLDVSKNGRASGGDKP